jgi:hypothetical protein
LAESVVSPVEVMMAEKKPLVGLEKLTGETEAEKEKRREEDSGTIYPRGWARTGIGREEGERRGGGGRREERGGERSAQIPRRREIRRGRRE